MNSIMYERYFLTVMSLFHNKTSLRYKHNHNYATRYDYKIMEGNRWKSSDIETTKYGSYYISKRNNKEKG